VRFVVKIMKKLILFTFMLYSMGSLAAQCNALPQSMANKAYELLDKHKKLNEIAVIDIYCEACRDEAPKPMVVDSVNLKDFQIKGYKQVMVNNKKIDLAYTYINGENVATIIGCKAVGINQYL
jgi:hypothetical protein